MERLNEIKNEISVSKGFKNWHNAFIYACRSEIISILDQAAIQYLQELNK